MLYLHGAELLHEQPLVARHAVDDDVEGHGVEEPNLALPKRILLGDPSPVVAHIVAEDEPGISEETY